MQTLKQFASILLIIDANTIGGAQKIASEINLSLVSEKMKFCFLLINKQDTEHKTRLHLKKNKIRYEEINLYTTRKFPSYRIARYVEKLSLILVFLKAIVKFKIDLVHIHIYQLFYLRDLFRILPLLKIPFVWTLHGDMNYPRVSRSEIAAFMTGLKIKGHPFVITQVSENINKELCNELVDSGISPVILPNGIDLTRFSFSAQAREYLRGQLQIPQHDLIIGSVGRLEHEKGFDLLINAFSLLPTKENCTLVIIGEGSLRKELTDLICTHHLTNKVILPGAKHNIPEWLSAFDIYIQPSRGEGFGLATLEAMSVGLPVITSNVGGLSYLLENGRAGLLVPADSPNELADAISLFARNKDLREKYSARALERSKEFSHLKMTNAYKKLYSSLLR